MGSFQPPPFDPKYQRANPYRDFSSDQANRNALRDLLFIKDSLSEGMIPTSLPDDNYGFYSELLRSLETRTDITWLIAEETRILNVIKRLQQRRGPLPEEPVDLKGRAQRLDKHWSDTRSESRPDRWEVAFDANTIPPLVENEDNESTNRLSLTPEHEEQAEAKVSRYLKKRTSYVDHLKNPSANPHGLHID